MKIVQVNTTDGRGGAARIASTLHAKYIEQGYDAWMAVGRRSMRTDKVVEVSDKKTKLRLRSGSRWAYEVRGHSGGGTGAISVCPFTHGSRTWSLLGIPNWPRLLLLPRVKQHS